MENLSKLNNFNLATLLQSEYVAHLINHSHTRYLVYEEELRNRIIHPIFLTSLQSALDRLYSHCRQNLGSEAGGEYVIINDILHSLKFYIPNEHVHLNCIDYYLLPQQAANLEPITMLSVVQITRRHIVQSKTN